MVLSHPGKTWQRRQADLTLDSLREVKSWCNADHFRLEEVMTGSLRGICLYEYPEYYEGQRKKKTGDHIETRTFHDLGEARKTTTESPSFLWG